MKWVYLLKLLLFFLVTSGPNSAWAADEHLQLSRYINEEIGPAQISLDDIQSHPELWLAQMVRYYDDCLTRGMDPDGLCIPSRGDQRRTDVLNQLAKALPNQTDKLLPLVEKIFRLDPTSKVRRAAYGIFAKMSDDVRNRWAQAAHDVLTKEDHVSRMEESLLYRAAVAVGANVDGTPATHWPVKISIVVDAPNIELALLGEEVDVNLSGLSRRIPRSIEDASCISLVLESWQTGGIDGGPRRSAHRRQ